MLCNFQNYCYYQKWLKSGCHSTIVYLEIYRYVLCNQFQPGFHPVTSTETFFLHVWNYFMTPAERSDFTIFSCWTWCFFHWHLMLPGWSPVSLHLSSKQSIIHSVRLFLNLLLAIFIQVQLMIITCRLIFCWHADTCVSKLSGGKLSIVWMARLKDCIYSSWLSNTTKIQIWILQTSMIQYMIWNSSSINMYRRQSYIFKFHNCKNNLTLYPA